jgi:iron complex transport system ATP-binding protein
MSDCLPEPDVTPLSLDGVTFGYEQAKPVLEQVTAELRPGRLCALIGPNAVGKTTLLRLILGQLTPWSGRINLAGRRTESFSPLERAAMVSYVPQRGMVSFAFTVEQVVTMGRHALRQDQAAIERALTLTDLQSQRQRVYHELSAGQQQRVLLARAMAQSIGQGCLMLLDEPGSMMDLLHVHRTMGKLKELAVAGMAVVVALHDLNLAARYADEVWLMDGGRLIACGPWEQVLVPAVLEPVYHVGLTALQAPGERRPVFHVGGVG